MQYPRSGAASPIERNVSALLEGRHVGAAPSPGPVRPAPVRRNTEPLLALSLQASTLRCWVPSPSRRAGGALSVSPSQHERPTQKAGDTGCLPFQRGQLRRLLHDQIGIRVQGNLPVAVDCIEHQLLR